MASLSRVWSPYFLKHQDIWCLRLLPQPRETPPRTHRPAGIPPPPGAGPRAAAPQSRRQPPRTGAAAPSQPPAGLVRRGSPDGSLGPQEKMLGQPGRGSPPAVPPPPPSPSPAPPALGTHLAAARPPSGPPPLPGAASHHPSPRRSRVASPPSRGLWGGGDAAVRTRVGARPLFCSELANHRGTLTCGTGGVFWII